MNIGATYNLSESMSVDLQVKNLTNRYYEYAWYSVCSPAHVVRQRHPSLAC